MKLLLPVIFCLFDFSDAVSLDHQHLALAKLLQVLQVGVREADDILEELLGVLGGVERLEGKQAQSHNIVAENVGSQDVRIFAILFGSFVGA